MRMFYVQYKKAVAALAPYDVQLYIVSTALNICPIHIL